MTKIASRKGGMFRLKAGEFDEHKFELCAQETVSLDIKEDILFDARPYVLFGGYKLMGSVLLDVF